MLFSLLGSHAKLSQDYENYVNIKINKKSCQVSSVCNSSQYFLALCWSLYKTVKERIDVTDQKGHTGLSLSHISKNFKRTTGFMLRIQMCFCTCNCGQKWRSHDSSESTEPLKVFQILFCKLYSLFIHINNGLQFVLF